MGRETCSSLHLLPIQPSCYTTCHTRQTPQIQPKPQHKLDVSATSIPLDSLPSPPVSHHYQLQVGRVKKLFSSFIYEEINKLTLESFNDLAMAALTANVTVSPRRNPSDNGPVLLQFLYCISARFKLLPYVYIQESSWIHTTTCRQLLQHLHTDPHNNLSYFFFYFQ